MSASSILLCASAGLALGFAFYGGLWITLRRLIVTRHPFALTMGSFLLRMAIALGGFLLVSAGRWQNALLCFAGFAAGRFIVSKVVDLCT
jgi:F1F0 ATPase subunit 2